MTRKILIALCVLFVMPVFVITGCDEVQENLTQIFVYCRFQL